MRLGQLARKLNIKPTQIVSFLTKEHSISIEDSLNSKIEDTILELVISKFKVTIPEKVVLRAKKTIESVDPITESITEPVIETTSNSINEEDYLEIEEEIDIDTLIESVTEEVANEIFEEEAIDEAIDVAIDNIVIDELNITNEVVENDLITEPVKSTEEIVEIESTTKAAKIENLTAYDEDGEPIELTVVDGVIKAPKKELEGFKVIGKIDLPQKAKAISFITTKNGESIDITETIEQTRVELTEHKREKYLARVEKRKLASKGKPSKSRRTLSEMDIREKQNKLAIEKQIQQNKVKKEQQKKHYEQNKKIITKPSTKKKKQNTKKGDLKDMKTYDKEPTTKWGRIWKWFNT